VTLRGERKRVALGQLDAIRQPLEDRPARAVLLDEREVDLGAEDLEGRRGRVDRRIEVDGPLDLGRRQVEVEDDLQWEKDGGYVSATSRTRTVMPRIVGLTLSRVKVMDELAASTFFAKTDIWIRAGVW
jgi:hypothetical protein